MYCEVQPGGTLARKGYILNNKRQLREIDIRYEKIKGKNFVIARKKLLDEQMDPCYNTYLCGIGVFCAYIGKER